MNITNTRERTPPRVLVVGGSGRVGSHLLAELEHEALKGTVRVSSASRRARQGGSELRLPHWVDIRYLELDDPATHTQALADVDRLFLLTGYTVAMLEQSKNLVDAAVEAGVSHIVHIGTFHPPGGWSSRRLRHFVWHQLVEAYIEHSGLSFTHLHPSTFMQNIIDAVDQGSLRMFFANQRIGMIDCRDIAHLAALALLDPTQHSGQRYFLSTEALTMDEMAAILSQELRRPIRSQPVSPHQLRRSPRAQLIEPAYFECIVDIAERMQKGELPDFAQTTNDFVAATGRPATSFRDFIRREIASFCL